MSGTGNITSGNIAFGTGIVSGTGNITTTANISGGNVLGGANVNATLHSGTTVSVTGTVTGASLTGTLTTASQTNISAVGTLTSLSVTGTQTAASTVGGVITGSSVSVTGTQTAASTVGGVMTGSSVSVSGAVTAASIGTSGASTAGSYSTSGGVTAASVAGGVITGTSTSVTGSQTAASTVGGVITGSSVSATGNVTGGNVVFGSGNISGTGNITGSFFIGNGSQLTGISGGGGGSSITNGTSNVVVAASGNVTVGVAGTSAVATFATTGEYVTGLISATGNVIGGNLIQGTTRVIKWTTVANTAPTNAVPGDFWYNSYSNIKYQYTNDGTGNVWVDQSAPTSFTTITVGSVVNANGNGVGNIGSSGGYFNTIFAKATSAQYADLAEMYVADQPYPAGTVVEFGGNFEITASTQTHSPRIAGVISTNPSYLMNSAQEGENVLPVALTGRVPCQIVGTVSKGDRLVASSITGVATRLNKNLYEPGSIIGKALEDYNSSVVGIIEIAVGRY